LKIKQFFSKYSNEISWFQYKKINPISTLDLNTANNKTTFKINLEDEFFSTNIQYYVAGE
jgi:hypothetical protein